MKTTITTDYITLGQFLKFANIIENGGASKIFLLTNSVLVNGEMEQRRGRKLYPNDIVVINDVKYQIEKDAN